MLISDVLHGKGRAVVTIPADATVTEAIAKLAEKKIGALVVEDRWLKMAGIFSERDFLNWAARHGANVLDHKVGEVMTSPVITCAASDRIDTVLARMTIARIRHMPVAEDGHLVGIVSIGDLVKHRLDEKELEANVLLELSRMRA